MLDGMTLMTSGGYVFLEAFAGIFIPPPILIVHGFENVMPQTKIWRFDQLKEAGNIAEQLRHTCGHILRCAPLIMRHKKAANGTLSVSELRFVLHQSDHGMQVEH